MKQFFHSESFSWTSKPKKGKPYGKRNVITIKNGKGTKASMLLNKSGKPSKKSTKKLSKKEINATLGQPLLFW